MIHKLMIIKSLEVKNKEAIFNVFFQNFYSLRSRTFDLENFVHLILRSINFFLLSLFIIYGSYFAKEARINFGIITCCLSVSVPLNCIISRLVYKEKMTIPMMIGTVLIIGGVSWLGLSKGSSSEN